MRKFEVEHNEKDLTKEEIAERQDFGKVVTSYEKTLKDLHKVPLYKNPKAFLALLVFLLILFLLFKSSDSDAPHDDLKIQQEQGDSDVTDE